MWAYRLTAPYQLERDEVAAPVAVELTAGRVLLRVLAGGICGSDLPKYSGSKGAVLGSDGAVLPGPPGYPMHEVVGEVISSRHPDLTVGQLVVGWAEHSDALAEFVVTDGEQLNGYDPGFSPETAVIVQSLACVLNALERVPVAGKHVAVLGLGPIGLLFAHAVKRAGAARVTGIDPMDRRSVAEAFGLDETVRTTSGNWARQLRPKDRPEVTVEAVGHQVTTLDDALIATATGGTVLYFGIPDDDIYPLNMERLVRGNLALVAGITRNRRRALADGNAYLRDEPGLSEHLITHRFEISSIPAAFAAAALPSANRIKVVLELG